ncbi:hypothetical protein A2U01_0094796 [Trifolium medium]|uniref:Uncharacterized protein n=1 Tax=Trifolium medium TaxID=97028 RepID=A0A392UJ90_9FABA|nr:hypothetical protein [Trifolium medium]
MNHQAMREQLRRRSGLRWCGGQASLNTPPPGVATSQKESLD